jgi:hypothetical protein
MKLLHVRKRSNANVTNMRFGKTEQFTFDADREKEERGARKRGLVRSE